MRLKTIYELSGKIKLLTGLHIGAGDTELHIGGTDNPVIKHPHTGEPYIPGSSLKGKVRSLLEMKSGLVIKTKDGGPLDARTVKNADEAQREEGIKILKIFGTSGADSEDAMALNLGPTRASFSDCFLDDDCKARIRDADLPFFEVKPENSINRITGTAQHSSLRFTERTVPGLEFSFSITLKEMDEDEKDDLLGYLLTGLKLLEMDALGGNVSRGYGRIQIKFDDEAIQKKFDSTEIFEI